MSDAERFLVTAAGGDIAEACGRILRDAFPGATVDGADSADVWPGLATFDNVSLLPPGDDPDYAVALRALVETGEYDNVLVLSESELSFVSRAPQSFEGLPILSMLPPETLARFLDKLETAHWLRSHGLPGPGTVELAACKADDLPVVVKPRRGHGGRGLQIVHRAGHLDALIADSAYGGHVAQTYLPDTDGEFTCALFRRGDVFRSIVMRRWLEGGTTVRVEVASEPSIDDLLQSVAREAALNGSINVQLRLVDGQPMIFEVNPRISGTVMMRHRLGFQDLLWCLAARRGETIPEYAAKPGTRVFRLARELVVSPNGQV